MTSAGHVDFADLWMHLHRPARSYAETEWEPDPTPIANLLAQLHPEPWHHLANCHGKTAIMFPRHADKVGGEARALCAACTVRAECLEQSIVEKRQHGFWGGVSARARRKLIKARVAENAAASAMRKVA